MSSPVLCNPSKHFNSLSYFSCRPLLTPSSAPSVPGMAPGGYFLVLFFGFVWFGFETALQKVSWSESWYLKICWCPCGKLCVIIFSTNSADRSLTIYVPPPLLCATEKSIVDFFPKSFQFLWQVSVLPKPESVAFLCTAASIGSPKCGWTEKAASWEYCLGPVPCFSFQMNIAFQAENSQVPKSSDMSPSLSFIFLLLNPSCCNLHSKPYKCKQIGFCNFTFHSEKAHKTSVSSVSCSDSKGSLWQKLSTWITAGPLLN